MNSQNKWEKNFTFQSAKMAVITNYTWMTWLRLVPLWKEQDHQYHHIAKMIHSSNTKLWQMCNSNHSFQCEEDLSNAQQWEERSFNLIFLLLSSVIFFLFFLSINNNSFIKDTISFNYSYLCFSETFICFQILYVPVDFSFFSKSLFFSGDIPISTFLCCF